MSEPTHVWINRAWICPCAKLRVRQLAHACNTCAQNCAWANMCVLDCARVQIGGACVWLHMCEAVAVRTARARNYVCFHFFYFWQWCLLCRNLSLFVCFIQFFRSFLVAISTANKLTKEKCDSGSSSLHWSKIVTHQHHLNYFFSIDRSKWIIIAAGTTVFFAVTCLLLLWKRLRNQARFSPQKLRTISYRRRKGSKLPRACAAGLAVRSRESDTADINPLCDDPLGAAHGNESDADSDVCFISAHSEIERGNDRNFFSNPLHEERIKFRHFLSEGSLDLEWKERWAIPRVEHVKHLKFVGFGE